MSHAENTSVTIPLIQRLRPQTLVGIAAILITAVLASLAAIAGLEGPSANPWMVVLDVAVGLAFVGSALLATGSWQMRALVGLVGGAWLVGSLVGAALLAHQAVLVLALVTFPTGRPRGAGAWIALAAAVPVALATVPQGLVAILFLAVAGGSLLRRSPAGGVYPFAAASGVGLALGASWVARSLDPFGYDPVAALVGYAVVLILVAIGFAVATRSIEDRAALRQRVLREESLEGLEGLGLVVADALDDPSIRVYRWHPMQHAFATGKGEPVAPAPSERWLPIMDASEPLGAIVHQSTALDDERTAAVVADALRLALLNLRWREALQEQLGELEAARARLLSAVDQERATVAARLRDDVVVHIAEAVEALREASPQPLGDEAQDAVDVAVDELEAARVELTHLVEGMGPAGLGDGGLVRLLRAVAARSPLAVEVVAESDAVGDGTAETALYYACMEAMANAAKHASSSALRLTIRRRGDTLEAIVRDDGVGGADPTGSGLLGLADRLTTYGGRLQVTSPPGAGTTLVAQVPASRASATPPA